MSLLDRILGRPIASSQERKEALSVMTGVPALGLDAMASTAYGPEAALTILLPLGLSGLHYFFDVSLLVVAMLIILYLSYQQTAEAYPNGGGAYVVASDNLGKPAGLCAAIALLIDYLLNVAVGISAGVGAIVSAIPSLQPYTLLICLIVLTMLLLLNLRGILQTGVMFMIPTFLFILCLFITICMGFYKAWISGGNPTSLGHIPHIPKATETITLWLFLGAFANGLTAMTGIEAVSNAIPLFKKPSVRNAQWTLSVIVLVLAFFLLALGYLCPSYHIVAMDETKPGYQTILSQLVEAVTGKGIFYYFSMFSIFIILTYSAQTSFSGFPRVCRYLADDGFLPNFFGLRGDRLVYSHGIILLFVLSLILLVAFDGITLKLIPMFAVGAFSAFLFSQMGMVKYWLRHKEKHPVKLFFNALGAVTTFIALIIIVVEKFMEGAWVVVVVGPIIYYFLSGIHHHYLKVARKVDKPLKLKTVELKRPVVIVPVDGWNIVTEKALRFALLLSDDITAVNVAIELPNKEDKEKYEKEFKEIWTEMVEKPAKEANIAVPALEIVYSPYRRIFTPILHYIDKIKKEKKNRIIAIILPELFEARWYEYILHNLHAAGLRALLFLKRDKRTVIVTIPWFLREKG